MTKKVILSFNHFIDGMELTAMRVRKEVFYSDLLQLCTHWIYALPVAHDRSWSGIVASPLQAVTVSHVRSPEILTPARIGLLGGAPVKNLKNHIHSPSPLKGSTLNKNSLSNHRRPAAIGLNGNSDPDWPQRFG